MAMTRFLSRVHMAVSRLGEGKGTRLVNAMRSFGEQNIAFPYIILHLTYTRGLIWKIAFGSSECAKTCILIDMQELLGA